MNRIIAGIDFGLYRVPIPGSKAKGWAVKVNTRPVGTWLPVGARPTDSAASILDALDRMSRRDPERFVRDWQTFLGIPG